MAKEEPISIRKFAGLCTVSEAAIRKAIKAGKFDKGYKPKDKTFIVSIALKEWEERHTHRRVQKPGLVDILAGAAKTPTEPGSNTDNDHMTVTEAVRLEKVYLAKKRQAEWEEMSGKLVDKDAVFKALFEIGKEVKQTIEQIPDRCIDEIFACKDRNEAHILLSKFISEALLSVATTLERSSIMNITKNG